MRFPTRKAAGILKHLNAGQVRQGDEKSGSRGWLAPAVLGAAAALGAAALYTNRKTHEAEHKYPPVGRFLRWTACACTTSSAEQGSLWCSSTATAP